MATHPRVALESLFFNRLSKADHPFFLVFVPALLELLRKFEFEKEKIL